MVHYTILYATLYTFLFETFCIHVRSFSSHKVTLESISLFFQHPASIK